MSDHTPGPWRWGFWKYSCCGDTSYYEFRPVGEMTNWDVLALASCEYGHRVDSRSNRPTVIEGEGGDDGESASVAVSDADMALVATAPKLLAACVRAHEILNETSGNVTMWAVSDVLDAAIKEAQREAT